MVSLISPEEKSYSFLLWPKMMTATSTEQRTESSCAFLNRPPLRFRNVLNDDISIGLVGKDCYGILRGKSWGQNMTSVQGPPVHQGRSGGGFAYSVSDMDIHREYSHRAIPIVFDSLDFNFSPTHCCDIWILCRGRHPSTRLARPESVQWVVGEEVAGLPMGTKRQD